jgi:protein gp37
MADETLISWADHTHNHWIGCARVSPACDGCYAAHLMETRMGRVVWGGLGKGQGTRSLTSEANRRKPLTWDRKAKAAGARPFVFCSSLADVFDNQVPDEWRGDLFELINRTPNLVWLLLTKRPQNIVKLSDRAGGLPRNAAIGTTVEDQERANINVPHLLNAKFETNALFAFLSCEPLLGPIDLTRICIVPKVTGSFRAGIHIDCLKGKYFESGMSYIGDWDVNGPCPTDRPALHVDWVISGGETDQGGHKARPTHPDLYRALRDQCAAAGIPYHHKQNGEWLGGDQIPEDVVIPSGVSNNCGIEGADDNRRVWRVGKKFSGRLLDGIEHNAFPAIRHMVLEDCNGR